MDSVLNAHQRATAWADWASEDVDVLVVGGGLTGAGVALDAATRGLRTALVEAQDWAGGASSCSSRLLHGWPRTPPRDPRAAAAAARERTLLARTLAPHLVRPVAWVAPFTTPALGRAAASVPAGWSEALSLAGAGLRGASVPRQLTRRAALERCPRLDPAAFAGALEVSDAALDDARLVLTLVRTAVGYGALAASRTSVVRLVTDGGRVVGAVVRDEESDAEVTIRARTVVLATGAWGVPWGEPSGTERSVRDGSDGRIGGPTGGPTGALIGGAASAIKEVYAVVRRDAVRHRHGLALPGGLSLTPGAGGWVLGAGTSVWTGPLRRPVATRADVEALLARANRMLRRPITLDDVVTTWAGVRPGVGRRPRPVVPPGVVVAGSDRLATYRPAAARAVDAALGKAARKRPSITAKAPLLGAPGLATVTAQAPHVAKRFGWTTDRVGALLGRYGSDVDAVLALVEADPLLASPLVSEPRYCRAEVAFACTHEGALHLEDILTTRVRLAAEHRDRGASAVDEIAAIAAATLGWDAERTASEKQHYRARVAAEADAAAQPTDAAAIRARALGPEVTSMPSGSSAGHA